MGYAPDPVVEAPLYTDDARIVCDIIERGWSLSVNGEQPVFRYKRDALIMDSRLGAIQVYRMHRSTQQASVDYSTVDRRSYVSVKVSNPDRDRHILWCEETFRILMSVRRGGPCMLGGYHYLEVSDDSVPMNDNGWYATTFNVTLVRHHLPVRTDGFGSRKSSYVPLTVGNEPDVETNDLNTEED